jgi:hypothetical protein
MITTNFNFKEQYITDENDNKIAVIIEINTYQNILKKSYKLISIKPAEHTLGDLLDCVGSWEGDDLQDCLELVYQTRSRF